MNKVVSRGQGIFARNAGAAEDRAPRTAKAVVYTLMAFLCVALVFSALTTVKELTRATGTLHPLGGARQLEHLSGGIVTAIYVEEGAQVKAGDIIAELSAPPIQADLIRTQAQSDQAKARLTDLTWLLEGLAEASTAEDQDALTQVAHSTQNYAQARLSLHRTTLATIDQAANAAEVEQQALQEARDAAWQRVALVEKRLERLLQLSTVGHVSEFRLMEEQERLEELRTEAVEAASRVEKASAESAADRARGLEEALKFREAVLKEAYDVELEVKRLNADIAHLERQTDSLVIRAPVSGIIQSIAFPSVGEVVGPGDPLFDLLPIDEPLVAEVQLDLTDIGHVRVGDRARLKVNSFDFRRFGAVDGKIVSLSPDAVEDRDGTHYIRAILALDAQTIGSGALRRDLRAGMQVSAEIQTGSRTVLAYLLKPIETSLVVALSER